MTLIWIGALYIRGTIMKHLPSSVCTDGDDHYTYIVRRAELTHSQSTDK